jgi:catechol-2,3-dioxygenase
VAFAHATLRDLLQAFEYLSAVGIEPVRAVNHRVTASLYYRDPDGNEVELYANCGPAEQLAEVAREAAPAWDPSALAMEIRAGATENELVRRLSGVPS